MCLSASSQLRAEVQVGETAPSFTLRDASGNLQPLSKYRNKFVVLEWTNYDCPFTKKFYNSGEMQKMQKEYTGRGVVWLSICSSAPGKEGNFTPEQIRERQKKLGVSTIPYLIDDEGVIGKKYGAKTTPTVFIVNPEGTVIYKGALDSIPSTDTTDIPKAKNYLRAALDAALIGNPIEVSSTKSYGCSVKY